MGIIDQGLGWIGDVLWAVVPFLLVLTPIVFIHELGHFLVARWCGVKVKAFSIGFGKEIFGFYDRHGTRWRFAWVPLGGYVKFMDDDNAASFPSRDSLERLTPAERAGAFQTKPLWARAAIVAAGPIANFLLAIAIFAAMFSFIGEVVTPPRVGAVESGGPADKAGFQPNDVIVGIDGGKVRSFLDVERIIMLNAGRELTFEVDRAGATVDLKVTPVLGERPDPAGNMVKRPVIGIKPPTVGGVVPGQPAALAGIETGDVIDRIDGEPIWSFGDIQKIVSSSPGEKLKFEIARGGTTLQIDIVPAEREAAGAEGKRGMIGIRGVGEYRRYGPVEATGRAVERTYTIIADSLSALYQIATRQMPADQLRGPLGIAEMSSEVAAWGPVALISLAALLSVAIGFFNLLPVPVLDGGHLLFYAIEAVRGEPLSERMQEISFRIGLALVLLLFMFVTYQDVIRRGWLGFPFG